MQITKLLICDMCIAEITALNADHQLFAWMFDHDYEESSFALEYFYKNDYCALTAIRNLGH